MSTAAIALDEEIASARAGLDKIAAKKKDGYTASIEEYTEEYRTIADAIAWTRTKFGVKPQGIARTILQKSEWAFTPAPGPVAPPKPPKVKVQDEPDLTKHTDWGSW
jgi:hypothetical protein